MINSEELIGTTEYLTLQRRCRINRCCYNRSRLYIYIYIYIVLCMCNPQKLTLCFSFEVAVTGL
jgi:hypothetical protein